MNHRIPYYSLHVLLLALSLVPTPTTFAQENEWMSTPYRSVIWLALPDDQETRQMWSERLPASLLDRCKFHFGAAMKCEIAPIPQAVYEATLAEDESATTEFGWDAGVPTDAVGLPDDEVWKQDKVFLVTVRHAADGCNVAARELDCKTRIWSPAYRVNHVELSRLDREIASALFAVFRCVGRITDNDKQTKQLTLEMRAGLLAGLSQAQTIPDADSIFYPVIRRVDRRGQVAEDSATVIPWTLLQVQRAVTSNSLGQERSPAFPAELVAGASSTAPAPELVAEGKVRCRMDSGLSSPFRMRSNRRVERLALLVTPMHDQTVFELRSGQPPHAPLLGYEIHARIPDEKALKFVGRSSWDGNIVVRRDRHPYKIYYVKHGAVLLARLPCAAGLAPRLTVNLPDHRERLMAEAFVNSIQDQLMDLVVRREVIAAQLRRLLRGEVLTQTDVARATALLDKIRQMNRADGLLEAIQRREAKFASQDASVQRRIDLLFTNLRRDIRKTVSDDYILDLQAAIEQAKLRLPKSAQ